MSSERRNNSSLVTRALYTNQALVDIAAATAIRVDCAKEMFVCECLREDRILSASTSARSRARIRRRTFSFHR